MNQSELSSFKKRNASSAAAAAAADDDDDDGRKDEEDVTAAKKCKSENFNSNHAHYFPNTAVSTSATLQDDGSPEIYRAHMSLSIRPNGCIDLLGCSANRFEPVHNSFQQVGSERTGDKHSVSREVQTVKEANNSDSVLVTASGVSGVSRNYITASGVSGVSRNYISAGTSICNFSDQDSRERKSSSNTDVKKTDIRMATNIAPSAVNRPEAAFSKEQNETSTNCTPTIVFKEEANSNQESDAQRFYSSIGNTAPTRSRPTTRSIEDSVKDLVKDFRRLRIYEPQNAESQYYVVAYPSEEGIQQCIITKRWRYENRKFVGKKWDLHSGTVYLFFTIYGTKQLCAVATLSPDQDHGSYIGAKFLRVIDLPRGRYTSDAVDNCKLRDIMPMNPDFGRTALEVFLEFEAEYEYEDKSIVDDINESLLARFGQNVGLRNLGNTCYINCILQCLAKIPWKTPTDENKNDELVTEFFRVMSWLSEPGDVDDDSISPQHLRSQIAKFSSRFASHQQQDAHELLLYLLGELNKRLKNLSANDENSENCVKDQFNGRLQNSVEFECGHNVDNDQPFFTVPLSIPENCRGTGSASVSDCLEMFLAEERMTGDNKAMCLDCSGDLKECTLRSQFAQLPSILILHIQRTDFVRLGKLETEITMPLRGLQMKDLSGTMYDYDLFAVCNHYGSLKGGHYTADVKCRRSKKWFTCSDSSVHQMQALTRQNPLEFRSNSATILFYACTNSH